MQIQLIALLNIACIILLVACMLVLIAVSFKHKLEVYPSVLIVVFTIPAYLTSLSRVLNLYDHSFFALLGYLALTNNVLLLPMIYLFVEKKLNPRFKYAFKHLLLLLPTLIMAVVLIEALPFDNKLDFIVNVLKNEHVESNFIFLCNDILVFLGMFIFYPLMFYKIKKYKLNYENNYSSFDYLRFKWIKNFVEISAIMFLIVFIVYMIDPNTDAWLLPLLNVFLMFYLVYNTIVCPPDSILEYYKNLISINQSETESAEKKYNSSNLSDDIMKKNCDAIISYLRKNKAFLDPNISVAEVSKFTQISPMYISQSLNIYLKQNFLNLVNEMRIEEVKSILKDSERVKKTTIDAIAFECGFKTKSVFYTYFKKYAKCTPKQYLKKF